MILRKIEENVGVIGQFERKYQIISKPLEIYNFYHYATKIKEKRSILYCNLSENVKLAQKYQITLHCHDSFQGKTFFYEFSQNNP